MGKAELETGFMDAPPGTHPPFISRPIEEPALTASKLEAVFASEIISAPHIPDYPSKYVVPIPNEVLKSYRLKEKLEPTEQLVGEDMLQGYSGISNNEETWFIGSARDAEMTIESAAYPYELNEAAKDLETRQSPVTPDSAHGSTLIFLAANIDQIGRLLVEDEIPESEEIKALVEVKLRDMYLLGKQTNSPDWKFLADCGVVDMVVVFPDGRMITNEVKAKQTYRSRHKNSRKRRSSSHFRVQTGRNIRGLQAILDNHNPDVPLPNISQFMSIYDESTTNPHVIKLLPKSETFRPFLSSTSNIEVFSNTPYTQSAAD